MGENFLKNTAQLGNILFSATFFLLNVARWRSAAVAQCRGGANIAVKTPRWWRSEWHNDLKGGACRGGMN